MTTLESKMAEFRAQIARGAAFEIVLMDAGQVRAILAKAEDGDREAQEIISAFVDWTQNAATQQHSGCFACGEPVGRGEVGMVVTILPRDRKGIGLCTVLCRDCRMDTPMDVCFDKLRAAMRNIGCEWEEIGTLH